MRPGMPVLEMTGGREPAGVVYKVTDNPIMPAISDHLDATFVRARLLGEDAAADNETQEQLEKSLDELVQRSQRPGAGEDLADWLKMVAAMAEYSLVCLLLAHPYGV